MLELYSPPTVYLLLGSVCLYALYRVFLISTTKWRSALRTLPGPPSNSLFMGNFAESMRTQPPLAHERWRAEYGHVYRTAGMFSEPTLVTTDLKALSYVIQHQDTFQKPLRMRKNLGSILGNGLLVAEGHDHTIQRRVLNPSFSPSQIRELTEVFVEKANKLRDLWLELSAQNNGSPMRLDVLSWLSKAALEVIGMAGFGYDFNALNLEDRPNELNTAFSKIFRTSESRKWADFVSIPLFGRLPTKNARVAAEGMRAMRRIGFGLIAQKKNAILAAAGGEKANVVIEKGDAELAGRDLLSVLIKANMATDLPASQRLSDEVVLSQVPTFITAGHETSSTATTWALFALSQNTAAQSRLRDELRAFPHDEPTMDELSAFPYLDAVVREMLRAYSPVTGTTRVAMQDDVIPLDKPFTDVNGKVQTSIRLRKGDKVMIPIYMVHRLEEIWGPDAKEYKPERWFNPPAVVHQIPTMWGNSLAFLAGQHGCIGYRFAIIEIKALLFALIRNFEFELAVPASDVASKSSIVQRPFLLSAREQGNQLPLIVKPYGGA